MSPARRGFFVECCNTMKIRTIRPTIRNLEQAKLRQGGSADKRASSSVRTRMRLKLWTRNPHCANCGKLTNYPAGFEMDHIVPLSQGGADTEQNCQILCIDCHRAKSKNEASNRYWSS